MKPPYLLRFEYLKSVPAKAGPFQSHDHYEIFYFHEGRGNYLIGDKIHPLTPGTLIVMHGLTLHSPCSFDGYPYVRTLINFDQAYIQAARAHLFGVNVLEPFERLGNYKIQLNEAEREEFEAILARMHRFQRESTESAYERFRLAFIDGLFFIYEALRQPLREQPELPSGKERHIQNVLTLIERHYADELRLELLEKELHLNKYHLSRLFREVTGLTIFQYVIRRKVNQAKLLFLTEPGKSVTDICYMAGFKNASHFSKAFKQAVGCTPEQYRRELRDG